MNGRDKTIVRKMLAYCEEIQSTHGYFSDDKDLFFDRDQGFIYRNSITMPILQIGELAKKLSEDFLAAHDVLPWKEMMRMRDLFARHYGSVDYSFVWETSHGDIKKLEDFLLSLGN